jgi:hypothetical protein
MLMLRPSAACVALTAAAASAAAQTGPHMASSASNPGIQAACVTPPPLDERRSQCKRKPWPDEKMSSCKLTVTGINDFCLLENLTSFILGKNLQQQEAYGDTQWYLGAVHFLGTF